MTVKMNGKFAAGCGRWDFGTWWRGVVPTGLILLGAVSVAHAQSFPRSASTPVTLAPEVHFVRPPDRPVVSSIFFYASPTADTATVQHLQFFVRHGTQSWEYPAEYVEEISLYRFFWDVTDFANGPYVITAQVEVKGGKIGQTERYVTLARAGVKSAAGVAAASPVPAAMRQPRPIPTATPAETIKPTLIITEPASGARVARNARTVFVAESNMPLESVQFFLDQPVTAASPDATFTAAPVDEGSRHWEFVFQNPVSALTSGVYTISANGKTAGAAVFGQNAVEIFLVNFSSATVVPLVVTFLNSPAGPITAPTYLYAQTNLPFTQVEKISFRVRGENTTRVFSGTAVSEISVWQWYWDPTEFSVGSYVISAEAQSVDGRLSSADVYLSVAHPAASSPTPVRLIQPIPAPSPARTSPFPLLRPAFFFFHRLWSAKP